ncbi:MAG: rhomboid family intramembrane serine protease [Blastocatellales bacterium]
MLLPIGRSEERARVTAVVVYSLIIANVLVFLMELIGGSDFISGFSVVPWEITHGEDLTRPVHVPGVGVIPQAPGPSPIYLTLLTAMFMHSGWLHIGGNMLYLWIFGGEIEAAFGHLKFLAFYLVCGLAAFVAQMLPDPDSLIPSLGASGAIAGVLGAYLRMFPLDRIRVLLPLGFLVIPIRLPALVVIGFWILLQFFDEFISITENNAQTLNGGVAYLAHIGGFVTGFALSFLWRRNEGIKKAENFFEN